MKLIINYAETANALLPRSSFDYHDCCDMLFIKAYVKYIFHHLYQ